MPRPRNIHSPEVLSDEDLRPLVGADGPNLAAAMFAISTWGTSTRLREQLMADSGFPLVGDVSAFLVVNQLLYRGVARPTELADAIDTGRSNISKVVARLEEHGLVVRAADPSDDRAVVVAFTQAGRAIGRRIAGAFDSIEAVAAERWTTADAEQLERLLVKLATALDAVPQHPLSAESGIKFRVEQN